MLDWKVEKFQHVHSKWYTYKWRTAIQTWMNVLHDYHEKFKRTKRRISNLILHHNMKRYKNLRRTFHDSLMAAISLCQIK